MISSEILIIDDEKRFRNSIKYAFRGYGYSFLEASFVQQGIDIITKKPAVRVVILDLSLQGSDGRTFLDYIKERSSDYRVIILTAHEEMLAAEIAKEYKVFNYLAKGASLSVQSVRFSVEQAFNDIERELLINKTNRLSDIQKAINSNQKLTEILDMICRSIRELAGGYTCHIRLYDLKKGDLALAAFDGPSRKMREIFEKPKESGQFFSGWIAREKKSKNFDDLQNDADFREFKKQMLSSEGVTKEMKEYFEIIRSAYIVPVFTNTFDQEVDAVLNISSDSPAFFTKQRCDLVDDFVSYLTLAITKSWLQSRRLDALRDYSAISDMLASVSEKLRGINVLGIIYDVVTSRISEIVNPESVAIFLHNENTNRLESVAELRGGKKISTPNEIYKPGQSLTGSVFKEGKTIRLPDPQREKYMKPIDDPRYDLANKELYLQNVPSGRVDHYLGVPIKVGNRKIGVLRAINKKSGYYETVDLKSHLCLLSRGFSDDCQNALEITASHLGIAIRNAELINQLSRQIERFKTLNEVGRLISSEIKIDELLKLAIAQTAKVMGAEICLLFLKDESGERVTLRQCYGMPMIDGAFYQIGEGITGNVAAVAKPELISRTGRSDGKYDKIILSFLREKNGSEARIESLMAVPLLAKGDVLGVIKVINKLGDYFQYNEEDLTFFEILASSIGAAAENANVYDMTYQKLAIAESLSKLVRGVAHEINNTSGLIPYHTKKTRSQLGLVSSSAFDIVRRKNAQGNKRKSNDPQKVINKSLNIIEDAATQAVDFAKELLGFSANRIGNRKPLDINGLIERAIKETPPELRRNKSVKISIKKQLSKERIMCDVYENPFIQIVRNIIINAYQAMEAKHQGSLTIRSYRDHTTNHATIEFVDTGCGVRRQDLVRIFDPDFTTKKRGNGLGLWLTKTFLDRMNGIIKVESVLNKGTKFTIDLPAGIGTRRLGD